LWCASVAPASLPTVPRACPELSGGSSSFSASAGVRPAGQLPGRRRHGPALAGRRFGLPDCSPPVGDDCGLFRKAEFHRSDGRLVRSLDLYPPSSSSLRSRSERAAASMSRWRASWARSSCSSTFLRASRSFSLSRTRSAACRVRRGFSLVILEAASSCCASIDLLSHPRAIQTIVAVRRNRIENPGPWQRRPNPRLGRPCYRNRCLREKRVPFAIVWL